MSPGRTKKILIGLMATATSPDCARPATTRPPHTFTRSELSTTYLPEVARSPSCSCWFGSAGQGRAR
jgi:hypothetical protein